MTKRVNIDQPFHIGVKMLIIKVGNFHQTHEGSSLYLSVVNGGCVQQCPHNNFPLLLLLLMSEKRERSEKSKERKERGHCWGERGGEREGREKKPHLLFQSSFQ